MDFNPNQKVSDDEKTLSKDGEVSSEHSDVEIDPAEFAKFCRENPMQNENESYDSSEDEDYDSQEEGEEVDSEDDDSELSGDDEPEMQLKDADEDMGGAKGGNKDMSGEKRDLKEID